MSERQLAPGTPIFFLIVDAIPFDLARELWIGGDLPGFAEPRPMVAVFPSLTEVAVPSLLRGIFPARPPGYEARWFDPVHGEVRGYPGDPESEAAIAPLRARPRGFLPTAAMYVLRSGLSYAQIRWITHRFRVEGGPWLGYLSATDGVAHFSGRESLRASLRSIAEQVDTARREHEQRTGVLPGAVLCSDHGMAFGRVEHLAASELAGKLATAGFEAVLAPCGEVGAGVVHVDPSCAADAARLVAAAPGVDLAFGRTLDGCSVVRSDGAEARIRWRDDRYRYGTERGDPLGYAKLMGDGELCDDELFRASWSHPYPDALVRVRRAFEDLVEYPAQVLFSMRDGWSYGPALTHATAQLVGGLVGTHGALSAAQTLGFAARTEDGADPWREAKALRPEDVFRPWRALVKQGGE